MLLCEFDGESHQYTLSVMLDTKQVDVEGAEGSVLEAAKQFLRHTDVVVFEIGQSITAHPHLNTTKV